MWCPLTTLGGSLSTSYDRDVFMGSLRSQNYIDRSLEAAESHSVGSTTHGISVIIQWVNGISLILSGCFFLTYIIVTWFSLTQISKLFTNQFVIFVVTMLGHILMFIFIITLYMYVFSHMLESIHPDSLILARWDDTWWLSKNDLLKVLTVQFNWENVHHCQSELKS